MTTGEKNTVVRRPFTQEAEWRGALSGKEPLLVFATTGYCIDAPEHLPAGSTVIGYHHTATHQSVSGSTWARG